MKITRSKSLALLLAVVMLIGLMPVAGLASSAGTGSITVTWYTDNTFAFVDTFNPPQTFNSLYDAFDSISSGQYATVNIGAGYRGDNSSFTMNQAAEVRLSSSSTTNVFLGTITMNNSSAILQLTNITIDGPGNAIDVRAGDLLIGSGSKITGASRGVYNRGGIVRFSGGLVSSYEASSSGTTVGTPSYITTPSPTPGTVAVTGVRLSPTDITMRVGQTQQLTATVSPNNASNKNVRYWSSDTSVATVTSGGLVRAVGSGWAYIRVTTVDGDYTAYSDIQVGSANVSVTGVTIGGGNRSVNINSSVSLTATVRPSNASNRNVTWSSSNTRVATVDSSGVVRGVSQGTATIRARTQDGGYTSSITVTVNAAAPPAAVSTDIARSTRLYLDGSSTGGAVARSTSFVQLRPTASNAVQENKMSVLVRAFDRLPEDGYSSLRYRLPWLYVDMGTRMTRGMDSTDRIEVEVTRLNYSYGTMNSRMNDKWRTYSNKNISGPWEVSSNSDETAMTLRILLPRNISKSNMRVLSWNGSSFVSMNTSAYGVVRIGTQYFLRISNVGSGVYAVVER